MKWPASRTRAFLLLWSLLALILIARRPPEAPLTPLPPLDLEPFRLDLNRDPWPRLTVIEGIGETLARRIVAHREEHGPFRSLEEVMAVPGVPDRPLREAARWLTLGNDL